MSKPEYDLVKYQNTVSNLHLLEIFVFSRAYDPNYTENDMLNYIVEKQIPIEKVLKKWEKKKGKKEEYPYVDIVPYSTISDWINDLILINTETLQRTGKSLRLQDIKGSMDEIRQKYYQNYSIIDLIRVLITKYNGDVKTMIEDAKEKKMMELEDDNYADADDDTKDNTVADDNDIATKKENKVPLKQNKVLDQVSLKFETLTIELPNDPNDVNVTNEDLSKELEKNDIYIEGDTFIFYDNEDQERQISVDLSNLFYNYKKFKKWIINKGITDKEITEEPLKYLMKIMISNLQELNTFKLVVQLRYERLEKERIEKEKKEAERKKREAEIQAKKKQGDRGVGLKGMRSMKSEIQKEVDEASTKKKVRRTVSTSNSITTEKKEPVQQSSTIPISSFPGEQSNNVSGANTINEDLKDVKNEKESFNPTKYELPEQIEIRNIVIKIDGKELNIKDITGLKEVSDVNIANIILGDKANKIREILEKYNKYLKNEYNYDINEFLLLLLMLREQNKLGEYKEIYNKIYEEQERIKKENERKQRELREQEEKKQLEEQRRLEELKKETERQEEERKQIEEQNRLRKEEEERKFQEERLRKEEEERKQKEEEERRRIEEERKRREEEDLKKTKLESTQKGQNERDVEMKQKEEEQNKFNVQPQGNPFSNQNMVNVLESNVASNYKFGYSNTVMNEQPVTQIIEPNIPSNQSNIPSNPPIQGMNTNQFGNDLDKPVKINKTKEIDLNMIEQDSRKEYMKKHKHMNVSNKYYNKEDEKSEEIEVRKRVLYEMRQRKRKELMGLKRDDHYKRMKEIYGNLYDNTVTRDNMISYLLEVINILLGISISKEDLGKILNYITLTDEIKKNIIIIYNMPSQLNENEYKILFLINMKDNPETLKFNLENIIRQIQGNAVTE